MDAGRAADVVAAAFQALPDPAAILDDSGTILETNIAWQAFACDNAGDERTTGVGINYLQVCERSASNGSEDAAEFAAGLRAVLAGERFDAQMEYLCVSPGLRRTFLALANRLHGDVRGAVVTHVDITAARISRDSERPLSALVDPLSGLSTQEVFVSRLSAALAERRRTAPVPDIGVLRIEVSGLSAVRTSFGQVAGNGVLQQIAHRLRRARRDGDTLARFGGTGMVVLAPQVDAVSLAMLAAQVRQAVDEPHLIQGRSVPVPVSISSYLATVGEQVPDVLRAASPRAVTAA
jgi:diguanylate cyclase (GGDEF)-like protein